MRMLTRCSGFLLNGSTGLATGCGVVSLVFASALEAMGFLFRRRREALPKGQSSTIALVGSNDRATRDDLERPDEGTHMS